MAKQDICPKHNIPLELHRDQQTGDMALACPACDLEKHGGSEADVKMVADVLKGKTIEQAIEERKPGRKS